MSGRQLRPAGFISSAESENPSYVSSEFQFCYGRDVMSSLAHAAAILEMPGEMAFGVLSQTSSSI